MKIKFTKKFRDNPQTLLRRCGYKPWYDPKKGKEAFIRRISRVAFYPRFHIFYGYENQFLVLDLHLDAKKPMHKKGIRTFEDEESEVVRKEAERIKNIIDQMPTF
jgi:hypothetical protein